jgi:hypothetical protein
MLFCRRALLIHDLDYAIAAAVEVGIGRSWMEYQEEKRCLNIDSNDSH